MSAEDLTIEPMWIATDWLRCGKSYPLSPPAAVRKGRDLARMIPAQYRALLPNSLLPVGEFIQLPLPIIGRDLITCKPETAFSPRLPSRDVPWLMTRPIPPKKFLTQVESIWGQQWFNGATSFIDHRFKGDPIPFWVLEWWGEMVAVISARDRWVNADNWLARGTKGKSGANPRLVSTIDRALSVLRVLPWRGPVDVLGAKTTTLEFSRLVSSDWINDDIIDMMMHHLAARVRRDPKVTSSVMVETLAFSNALIAGAAQKKFDHTLLKGCASLVKHSGRKRLFLPYNLNENHWMAFEVDFTNWSISYGDSMAMLSGAPVPMLRALSAWLHTEFGQKGANLGNRLDHGVQTDSESCGIVTPNTIGAAVFGDQLWSPSQRVFERTNWFLILVDAHQARVAHREGEREIEMPAEIGEAQGAVVTMEQTPDVDDAGVRRYDKRMEIDCQLPEPESTNDRPMTPYTHTTAYGTEAGRDLKRKLESPGGTPSCHKKKKHEAKAQTLRKPVNTKHTTRTAEERPGGPVGIGKSTRHDAAANAAVSVGKFKWTVGKLEAWREKVLEEDNRAEFDADNMHIRHFKCGKKLKIDAPYDVTKFRKHVSSCEGRGATAGMSTLWSFLEPKGRSTKEVPNGRGKSSMNHREAKTLCGGITVGVDPRVTTYLLRTGSAGGGSDSVTTIADELFGQAYRDLDDDARRHVDEQQKRRQSWRNDHENKRVFAVACASEVVVAPGARPLCGPCTTVWKSTGFRNAVRLNVPGAGNYKFLNKKYKNTALGELFAKSKGLQMLVDTQNENEHKSLPLRFAQHVARGDFKKDPVFLGLVEAMVTKADKSQRGVGMQNFKYTPAFDEFTNLIAISSPRTYRFFRDQFAGRTERTFRAMSSNKPRFPIGISKANFNSIEDQLRALEYTGPCALSCDDTKLHQALRMFYDGVLKKWFLVGGVGEPMAVGDVDELRAVIAAGTVQKATKIRIWCLQIPLPKVPPLVIAAKAISTDMSANDLLLPLQEILEGLWSRNIQVLSYSCDGTEVERSLQRLCLQSATWVQRYYIKNSAGGADIQIPLSLMDGHPLVMLQDSKHGLKTFRNNLFSGARLLVLGNYLAMYGTMRAVAFTSEGPLYHRDVEKLDRQDDRAATRLFSAATLQHLATHFPNEPAQIIYLFTFGELIDAYQNRSMSHIDRIKIALRTHYFLEMWTRFLHLGAYPLSRYFISRESHDIAHILIEGIISLILSHRDFVDHSNGPVPLLPWLHSTEGCEHTFGECRSIVKDFTHLDFLYMQPKLRLLLRAALNRKHDGSNGRAEGYAHTWFDCDGIDLITLATYPSDDDINLASDLAFSEAENLFISLDVTPSAFMPAGPASVPRLPGVSTFLNMAPEDPNDDAWSDDESIIESEVGEATLLQELINQEETVLRDAATSDRIRELTFAAIATSVDDTMRIHELPDEDIQEVSSDRANIATALGNVSLVQLPALQAPDERQFPLDRAVASMDRRDYSVLVAIRQGNQTRQAASGIRHRVGHSPSKEASTVTELIRAFQNVLHEQQDTAAGTGVERAVRWTGNTGQGALSGNAANAALAGRKTANEAVKRRAKALAKHMVPLKTELTDAEVSQLRPLRPTDYGFLLLDGHIMVGRVIWLYSKGGGKNGTHGLVPQAESIGQISYIALQVYEQRWRAQFRAIHHSMSALFAAKFAHLPANSFLCRVPDVPQMSGGDSGWIDLSARSLARFEVLHNAVGSIKLAVKSLGARRKHGVDEDEDV